MSIKWFLVSDNGGMVLGAVGFIDGKTAVIASFYEDADANMDGSVGNFELLVSKVSPVGLTGHKEVKVAMLARGDYEIMTYGSQDFRDVSTEILHNFNMGMVYDAVYNIVFSRAVGAIAGAASKGVAQGAVKQFVIRKGMETAVKNAYNSATH